MGRPIASHASSARRSAGRTIVGVRRRNVTPAFASSSARARIRPRGGTGCRRNGSNTISVAPADAAARASSTANTFALSVNVPSRGGGTAPASSPTMAAMRAVRSSVVACRVHSRRTDSSSVARWRMRLSSLTGRKSPAASAARSMVPSTNSEPPNLPSCARNTSSSNECLLAGASGTWLCTTASSPRAVNTALSGAPADPKRRTSIRCRSSRSGIAIPAIGCARLSDQPGVEGAHDFPSDRDVKARMQRLPYRSILVSIGADRVDAEAQALPPGLPAGRFKAHSISFPQRHLNQNGQFIASGANDDSELRAVIVRVGARHVSATRPTAQHATSETPAEDLHERRRLLGGCRRAVAAFNPVEQVAIRSCHGRDVFGLLLSPLDLERDDAEVHDRREGARAPTSPSPRSGSRDRVLRRLPASVST